MLKIFPKFKATFYEIKKKKIDDNKIEILILVV